MRMSEREVRALLTDFGDAWSRRDIATLLGLMTEDAVYCASVGPEPGRRYVGHEEISVGLDSMFAHDEGAVVVQHKLLVMGARAVSRWTYTFDNTTKPRPREEGIDLWEFQDGRIRLKDAYRKVLGE